MAAAGCDPRGIATFLHYFDRLSDGADGLIPESAIEPIAEIPSLDSLRRAHSGPPAAVALDKTVVIKLNGGLGTSMGLDGPKSLLRVRGAKSFLDIAIGRVLDLRQSTGARLPLVFMNSQATEQATLKELERQPAIEVDLVTHFLQSQIPRLDAHSLEPVTWPAKPQLEWCPPGHGDVYLSLATSGLLREMRQKGYRYAFISNSDNLGAVCDSAVVSWMEAEEIPFVAEQCARTPADRKGGHLAHLKGEPGLILRETAQTPGPPDARHGTFNINNIYVDLDAINELLEANNFLVPLSLIVNQKNVVAGDASTPRIVQLETAMASLISHFPEARAVLVPRDRFLPVKTTDDLLLVRSDKYDLDADFQLRLRRPPATLVTLDREYYAMLDGFEERFAEGPPSLLDCTTLTVEGDVTFGAAVTLRGDVAIRNRSPSRATVPGGSVIEGELLLD